MDNQQLLWGVNTLLIGILGAMVRHWISNLEKKIEAKLDTILCIERHATSTENCEKLFKHRHAPLFGEGKGGEVIIP
jgi:hypothetical protein